MSRSQGNIAEDMAHEYLRQQGLTRIAQNYYCRMGEIDLIMLHDGVVVFVEVRQRTNQLFGNAMESISVSKRRKLIQTAELFLMQKRLYANYPCRFDVVSINGKNQAIQWLQHAFDLNHQ